MGFLQVRTYVYVPLQLLLANMLCHALPAGLDTCHFISSHFTLPWLAALIPPVPSFTQLACFPPSIVQSTMSFWCSVLNREVLGGEEQERGRQRRRRDVWDLWSFQFVISVPYYKMQSKLCSEKFPFPYNLSCLYIQNRLIIALTMST